MEKLIYKVAPHGEGKTSWLVDKAFFENGLGKSTYLMCKNNKQYRDFRDLYLTRYSSVCPVLKYFDTDDLNENSVLLIDDLLEYQYAVEVIRQAAETCNRIYITLSGSYENSDSEVQCADAQDDFQQLQFQF